MPRHGNASKSHCGSYYRKDDLFTLKNKADELIDAGKSTEQIYSELKKVSTNTVGETACSHKLIDNRNFVTTNGNALSEVETLICNEKSISIRMPTVDFSERDYVSCSFLPHMISKLK